MKISSVYIVKNEEKNIEQSINSIKNICDEIIIVDTGSTDDTVKICEKLQCKIYHYEWDNNFAKARNYAISLCSNDIIIFLDADEYFTEPLQCSDKEIILQYFKRDIDTIGCLETDIEKTTKEEHHTQYVYKIFRNNLRFRGVIHEFLVNENRDLKVLMVNDFALIHTGYSAEISRSKVERNLKILNSITSKETMDYYYLGRENLFLNNYEEADKYLNLFFQDKQFKYYITHNNLAYLAYIYKYRAMKSLPDLYSQQDILEMLLQAQKQIPHIPEIYFCLGEYYFNVDMRKSLEYFDKCIKVNEDFGVKHFELNNFIGYQDKIYYYKSKILDLMGDRNGAIQRAIVCCMLNKKDTVNIGLLLYLLNRNKTEQNIELLNKIYKPKNKQDYEFLVRALENTDLYFEFLNFALIYNQEFQGGIDSLYYAMMLNQNYKAALDSLIKFDNDKKNFIMSVILLYANDVELMQEYFNYLSEEYINILQVLILQDFNKNINFDIMVNVICKLMNYGVKIPIGIMQYVLKKCSAEQLNQILNICFISSNYETANGLASYYLKDLGQTSEQVIFQYLFSLYKLKQYEQFIDEYNNFVINDTKPNQQSFALLKLINKNMVTKSYLKKKRHLEKELSVYA